MTTERLEVQIVEDKGSTNKLIASVNGLASASDKLATSTDKSTKATSASGDAADKAAVKQGILSKAMGGVSSAGGLLASALGGIAGALSVSTLVGYADTYAGISNKLRLVTTDQTKLNAILDGSFKIAQDTGTSFEQVANTYGKVSGAVKKYGLDAKDTSTITKAVAEAIVLTGASSEDAANGLRQFGQLIGGSSVQAEELNSIIDSTPGLAKAIEGGLVKAGVAVSGSLKTMAETGQLSIKQVLEALKAIEPELNTLGKGAIPTVAQAFTRLQNAVLKYVGEANNASGASRLIIEGIALLARNVDILIPSFLAFAGLLALGALANAVIGIAGLASGFASLIGPIVAATAAMLLNPVFLIATIATLAAVGAGVYLFGDKIKALAANLGPAAVAALGLTTATTGTGTAATAAATASTAHATAVASVGTAATAAAPQIASVGTAATSAGAAIEATRVVAANTNTELARVQTVAGGVSTGFTTIATGASSAGKGFSDLTLKGTGFVEVVKGVASAAPVAATGITNTGTAAGGAATTIEQLKGRTNEAKDAFEALVKRTNEGADANKNFAADAEKAREALEGFNKAAAANEKAIKDAAERLEKFSGNYNQLGEKVATAAEILEKYNKRQQENRDLINKAFDNLKQYYGAVETTTSSLHSASNAAQEAGGSFTALGQTFSSSQDALDALNLSLGNYAALSQKAKDASFAASTANTAANKGTGSVKETVQKASGTGESVTTGSGGNTSVSNGVYHGVITYNGKNLAAFVSNGVATDFSYDEKQASALQSTIDAQAKSIQDARAITSQGGPRLFPFDDSGKYWKNPNGFNDSRFFAHGGSFMVGGTGGTDSQQVSFRASPDERVTVETPAQQNRSSQSQVAPPVSARDRQPTTLNFIIKTDDVDAFRRNRRQIAQDAARRLARG